jgi:deoxyribonuclease V
MMKIRKLHPWKVDCQEAIKIQESLRKNLILGNTPSKVRLIAGADASYCKKNDKLYAAVITMDLPDLTVVEEASATRNATFPYIPGLLTFREAPPLLIAFKNLKKRPDAVIFDGQGIAHPRGLGLASHLGLILDVPTVGCAKKRLIGQHQGVGNKIGSYSPLKNNGEIIGAALRTKRGVKPVFVSCGHKIDLPGSIEIILKTCRGYRLPEPTRQAHLLVNRLRKEDLETTSSNPND